MKLLIILLAVWLGIASAAEPQRSLTVDRSGGTEKRVALVIGNAAYKSGPLVNPVNDARAIASRLRSLGFDVVLRENLKQREIGGIYREFRSKITPGGVALVFYAGHGVQFKGQNYFPATDAEIFSEEDVPLQSLNLGNLLDNMEEAKAGVSLVFLDACRDNPFARRFRSSSRGLAKVEAASGTLIHYATRPGSVASDGEGQNGTYTEALLVQMSEPGVPVELMLKRVANNVVAKTKGKQEPWVEGSLRGDFYFRIVAGATSGATPQLAVPVDLTAVEISFWESIKSSTDAEDYQAYLDKYPNGQFVALAERRTKKKPAKTDEPVAGDVNQAVSIPIANFSFENPSLGDGRFNFRAVAGWTVTGEGGVFHPHQSQLPQKPTDGIQTGWANRAKFSQSLSAVLAANKQYILNVDLLHRSDEPSSSSTLELLAGSTVLASSTITGGTRGTIVLQTVSFLSGASSPHLGQQLGINLISDGVQSNWDNVRLFITPAIVSRENNSGSN